MQPLVWGFEPLMDINGIQVVLHAFAWFVTYLFAGCILNGAPGGTRIRNPLHGKEMRWPITLLTHYGASYLCCPGLFNIGSVVDGCCPNDACQDTILRWSVTELSRNVWMREEESNLRPTAPNAKRIAVCAFKFWLGGSLTMVGDGRVELPSSVYQTLIIAVILIANKISAYSLATQLTHLT